MAPICFAVANIVQKIKLQNKNSGPEKKNSPFIYKRFLFHGFIG